MIKKNQKVIALFAAVAFLSLLQVSAMPLGAEQSPDQAGASIASPEQAPNFIEEEGESSTHAKKSVLPIILGVVAAGAVIAVLALVVLKTKYDITGTWNFSIHFTTTGYTDYSSTWVFSGSKESGTFVETEGNSTFSGSYTVTNKKNVSFTYNSYTDKYVGKFDSKDKMSGTFSTSNYTGTWTASKKSSSTASLPSPSSASVASALKKPKKG